MEFESVIGLEIHAQMSTKTKLFCSCDNDSFGKAPNSNVCPICMGFPGTLPVPSKEAIEKGIKAALALKCKIPQASKFDRKNYFYPDLPCGFQISQYDEPISENGEVSVRVGERELKVRITRLHIENDAGKLTHTGVDTLLDFNRAGTPLMEIVSEPDLRTAEEAKAYAETVQGILRAVGSSDADMEKGMLRFDASVSLRPKGEDRLYPRAEIKNLNSFRSLERAIEYEIKRQKELWEEGKALASEETVGWDDDRGSTQVLRSKESAADYRYFPEPDIPPVEAEENVIKAWKGELPELPLERMKRYIKNFELTELEARFYAEEPSLADLFESTAKSTKNIKASHAFVGTILVKALKDQSLSPNESPIQSKHLTELIQLVDAGTISNNVAKGKVFEIMMKTGELPKPIVEREGLAQMSDDSAIESWCQNAIDAHPEIVEDFKSGKEKALGALVGMIMKESKGKANPGLVNQKLRELLNS